MSKKLVMVLLTVVLACGMMFAEGQSDGDANYPSKEVTCIVIAKAGGGTDAMARATVNPLEDLMGQPFVVVNNGSGGGLVAMGDICDADPDGYTVGVFSNTDVANFAYTQPDCGFTVDDFTYISAMNNTGDILVLKKGSQFKGLDDFLAYAKANPGKVTVALPSPIQEMSLSLTENALGVDLTGVVYGGGGKVLADILGGHVEAGILSAKFIKQLTEEKITILGLMLNERLSTYPDVPTFTEQGYPVDNPAKRMLVGPKNLPQDVVDSLVASIKEGFQGQIKANIENIGEMPMLITGAELESFLEKDFAVRKEFLTK